MGKTEYQAYLASREWAVLKEQIRKRSGGQCERCKIRRYEQTHHLTYARVGHERPEDLQALCSGCHKFVSAISDEDPLNEPVGISTGGRIGDVTCFCGSTTVERVSTGYGFDGIQVRCGGGHGYGVEIAVEDGHLAVKLRGFAEIQRIVQTEMAHD